METPSRFPSESVLNVPLWPTMRTMLAINLVCYNTYYLYFGVKEILSRNLQSKCFVVIFQLPSSWDFLVPVPKVFLP